MSTSRVARRRAERLLGALALLTGAAVVVLGLVVAPPDAVQGQPQRLMYVHVPAAWVAYLAFLGVFVASIAYLVTRSLAWDRRAQAAAELGVGLTALAIALGSLWGRPVWGVWWTWDPRIVTTSVLLLVYVGYLAVRSLTVDAHANARRAAVVGIVGFVNVPIVHFSVVWWRTLHQPPTLLQPGVADAPIAPEMLAALLAGVVAFTLGAVWLFLHRVRNLALSTMPAAPTDTAVPVVTVRRSAPQTEATP